jgi:hypothetical protein
LELGLPGSVVLLMIVGLYESRARRNGKRGRTLSKTYVDEVTAFFYGTKRRELEHHESMSLMRDEEGDGAPPEHGVDLDRGTVRLRPKD